MTHSIRRQLRLLHAYVVCTLLIFTVLAASSFKFTLGEGEKKAMDLQIAR